MARPANKRHEHMQVKKTRTFVSDGEVVGFVPAPTGRVGHHTNLYAVAKRRINK